MGRYYGLNGLDKYLEEKYFQYNDGYFVELGANDGLAQSNTAYFEQSRGWRGILVEPVLHNFLQCLKNRPNSIAHCNACISFDYKDPVVRLIYFNLMTVPIGIQSDLSDPMAHASSGAQWLPSRDKENIEFPAYAKTLESILELSNAPHNIDLLSLDVEGGELEVLRGIDFSRYTFRVICVEARDVGAIQDFLCQYAYELVEVVSQDHLGNAIFCHHSGLNRETPSATIF